MYLVKCWHFYQQRAKCCMTCIVAYCDAFPLLSLPLVGCMLTGPLGKKKHYMFTVNVAVCCTHAYLSYPHHISHILLTSVSLLVFADMAAFNQTQAVFEQLLIKQKSVFDLLWVFKHLRLFSAWRASIMTCCWIQGPKPIHPWKSHMHTTTWLHKHSRMCTHIPKDKGYIKESTQYLFHWVNVSCAEMWNKSCWAVYTRISGQVSQFWLQILLASFVVGLSVGRPQFCMCVFVCLNCQLACVHVCVLVVCMCLAVNMVRMEICVGLLTCWQDVNESKWKRRPGIEVGDEWTLRRR